MKKLKQFTATAALTFVLASSAFAGDISMGKNGDISMGKNGDISMGKNRDISMGTFDPVTAALLNILQTMFSFV